MQHNEFRFVNDGIQYRYKFNNGIEVSVIMSPTSYGGPEGLWEIGIFEYGMMSYGNDITGDDAVLGYLTWEKVQNILKKIEKRGLQLYKSVV